MAGNQDGFGSRKFGRGKAIDAVVACAGAGLFYKVFRKLHHNKIAKQNAKDDAGKEIKDVATGASGAVAAGVVAIVMNYAKNTGDAESLVEKIRGQDPKALMVSLGLMVVLLTVLILLRALCRWCSSLRGAGENSPTQVRIQLCLCNFGIPTEENLLEHQRGNHNLGMIWVPESQIELTSGYAGASNSSWVDVASVDAWGIGASALQAAINNSTIEALDTYQGNSREALEVMPQSEISEVPQEASLDEPEERKRRLGSRQRQRRRKFFENLPPTEDSLR
eukprot:TRINITY_DN1080_c0_g2_i1.p1 TRINITY_DN1080_c0_g2~~TRINITY_DN1080_c0_g2_i1.p1  ORF type:complete len:300 (-),score=63.36 TRINITY_DN1080_c0_g2_i1:244-1080(-)